MPCYNEEESIDGYFAATQKVAEKIDAEFEYVFVDDGSTDGTLQKMRTLAAAHKNVKYISFSRNFGKESAIFAGLKRASGDIVGLMDVDLQDPPELLKDMYAGIVERDCDCVACRRVTRKGESKIRSFFARTFYKLFNRSAQISLTDGARDYRLMTRDMCNAVISMSERERFSKGIFAWVGFRTEWLEYENIERAAGSTKWNFKKLVKYAVNGIEDFTDAPLKFNLVCCVLTFLVAFALSVTDIVWAAIGHGISTAMIILPVVFLVCSMLFLGIMVVGEYVKKTFHEVKARPYFVVRETDDAVAQAMEMGVYAPSADAALKDDVLAEVAATADLEVESHD